MKAIFVCTYPQCGKAYVNSSILKRHMQAFHSSVKRFQCSSCGKCLASRQNLKEHYYIHTGEKPYVCPISGCGAAFRQGTHLSAHKKLEHSGQLVLREPNSKFVTDFSFLLPEIQIPEETQPEEVKHPVEIITLPPIGRPYTCKLPNIFETFTHKE